MAWKLHSEIVLLAGWGRAILLQIAHPLVAEGVARHSSFLAGRWGRLNRLSRTIRAMLTLSFGTAEEADGVARGIRGIHDRVHGETATPGGPLSARTRYSAHDPALLTWVHATLLDSFLLTYERFVRPLSGEERDRYCAESSAIEPLLGIPAGRVPRSAAALRDYLDSAMASGEIAVTETARRLAQEIVDPPAFAIGWPLLALVRLSTSGLLPPSIREGYGLPWDTRRQRALDALTATSRRSLPLLPSALRHWPAARAARAREHG